MECNKKKEVLINVIELYKGMPFLWQKENKDYLNKEKRAEGFRVLLEVYKKFDENATIKGLKKKIENLRTCYTKELKKVLASKHTVEANEVYVPSLWYYELFHFLGSRTVSSSPVTDPLKTENLSSSDEDASSVATSSNTPLSKKIKKTHSLLQNQEQLIYPAENMLSQKEEQWEVFGRSIGLQMKDLNKRQLIIAQKLISDVIFYGKLNRLSEDSYVVTKPSGGI